MKTFEAALREHNIDLKRHSIKILQVYIGKRCNQACHHCHCFGCAAGAGGSYGGALL